ncbi:hypothetical protein Tco_1512309 [Tanacetum coccineum]
MLNQPLVRKRKILCLAPPKAPRNLGGNKDEPRDETASRLDWFQKPTPSQEPTDPNWNVGKTTKEGPTQMWLMNLAASNPTDKSLKDIDELMSTPIDFSGVPFEFFINNDLKYLQRGISTMKYKTSTTKTKAAKYDLPGIEDMVPNIWSPAKEYQHRILAKEKMEHIRKEKSSFHDQRHQQATKGKKDDEEFVEIRWW